MVSPTSRWKSRGLQNVREYVEFAKSQQVGFSKNAQVPDSDCMNVREIRTKKAADSIEKLNISIEKANIFIEKLNISIEKTNISIKKLNISIEKTNISIEKLNISIEKPLDSTENSSHVTPVPKALTNGGRKHYRYFCWINPTY